MKIYVKKKFTDKNDHTRTYMPGTVATFDDSRAEELINNGYAIEFDPATMVDPNAKAEADFYDGLFDFQSEDTPLLSMMLKAQKIKADSPEVEHYSLNEQSCVYEVSSKVPRGAAMQFELCLARGGTIGLIREHQELFVCGVEGYTPDGQDIEHGSNLLLSVMGYSNSGNFLVRAHNGPKSSSTDLFCTTPEIPSGSKVIVLSKALHGEENEDDFLKLIQPEILYLQKRGLSQTVSDYLAIRQKGQPVSNIAIEQAVINYKRMSNRTLWSSYKFKRPESIENEYDENGRNKIRYRYFTGGLRWQFKREIYKKGAWTTENIIGAIKLYYCHEDTPESAFLLAGRNLLEAIQCIDTAKYPEISISQYKHPTYGWNVACIHTVFGDIYVKHEPTLDKLGWSNSGAIIGENRLVRYIYKQKDIEPNCNGANVWEGIAMKGTSNIWLNGEGTGQPLDREVTKYIIWENDTAPTGGDLNTDAIYYLAKDVSTINQKAVAGSMWDYDGSSWTPYVG